MWRLRVFALSMCALTACTPGALSTPSGGGTVPVGAVTIDVDLTKDPAGAAGSAGNGGGYAPLLTSVSVGASIRFTNSDGFAHTATSISTPTFPSAYPFTGTALTQRGATLSGGFSTGSLAAGAGSQTLLADKPGLYLFGCFYHYGTPMRAAIDVH